MADVGPPNLRRRRGDDDDDEDRRPRKFSRRMDQSLEMTLRAQRRRELLERLQRIRLMYMYLRLRVGIDQYNARHILELAFDADEIVLAFSLPPAGPPT